MSYTPINEKCQECGKEFNIIDLYSRYAWKDNKRTKVVVCRECARKLEQQKVEKAAAKKATRKRRTTKKAASDEQA